MSKEITIKNNFVQATVSSHAAEVISFKKIGSTVETIWSRNPQHWRNCNPLLFPYAGPLKDGKYTYDGKEYFCGQHGFARDMDFILVEASDTEVRYRLGSTPETLAKYPWPFVLEISYKLHDNKIDVIWEVSNPGPQEMFFQIGAHPAFYYKDFNPEKTIQGYFSLLPIERHYKLSTITEKTQNANKLMTLHLMIIS